MINSDIIQAVTAIKSAIQQTRVEFDEQTLQKAKTVEYALRDTNKPMGVATYKAINVMPEECGKVLGKLEGLVELL